MEEETKGRVRGLASARNHTGTETWVHRALGAGVEQGEAEGGTTTQAAQALGQGQGGAEGKDLMQLAQEIPSESGQNQGKGGPA